MSSNKEPQWQSSIEAALRINSAQDIEWHDQSDLVIVGFGGAGVCAAIEAADQHLNVIAIDRFQGGGATAMSGGVCYLGGGTRHQRKAGYEDTPENMFNYLQLETQGVVKEATLRRFCTQSVAMQEWLEDNGVHFNSSLSPVKTSYPARQYYLYYSGNETVPDYAQHAKPAPRGHRTVSAGMSESGAAFYHALKNSALKKGVALKTDCLVKRLIIGDNEQVLGVEVAHFTHDNRQTRWHKLLAHIASKTCIMLPFLSKPVTRLLNQLEATAGVKRERIRALKGVLLSTGGFIRNRAMVEHFAPKYRRGMPLGNIGCDGSGILLGRNAGAKIDRMDRVSAWRFINPPIALTKGIVVDKHGERYCNEQLYGATLGYHMVEKHQGRAIVIVNRALFFEALKQSMPWKIWSFQALPVLATFMFRAKRGKTIESLANSCAMPVDQLKASLQQYNEAARHQHKDRLGKADDHLFDLSCGPYYAFDISLDSKTLPCATITFGGLVVDEDSGEVMHESGHPIKGLYAAGRTAVGIPSNLYVSGLSIADCVFSGRRAANHCARIH